MDYQFVIGLENYGFLYPSSVNLFSQRYLKRALLELPFKFLISWLIHYIKLYFISVPTWTESIRLPLWLFFMTFKNHFQKNTTSFIRYFTKNKLLLLPGLCYIIWKYQHNSIQDLLNASMTGLSELNGLTFQHFTLTIIEAMLN